MDARPEHPVSTFVCCVPVYLRPISSYFYAPIDPLRLFDASSSRSLFLFIYTLGLTQLLINVCLSVEHFCSFEKMINQTGTGTVIMRALFDVVAFVDDDDDDDRVAHPQ